MWRPLVSHGSLGALHANTFYVHVCTTSAWRSNANWGLVFFIHCFRTVQINDVYKDMTLTGQGIDTSLHLDSPTAKISTRKKAPLFKILQRILSCASDLTTLDVSQMTASPSQKLILAVNSRPCLKRLVIIDFEQLYPLPRKFLSSTPLSRIHCRRWVIDDDEETAMVPPHFVDVVFARGSDGPHTYKFHLDTAFDRPWTSVTFNSLQTLHVECIETDIASSCSAFFDRHTSLRDIYLSGPGLRDHRAIEHFPILSSFYSSARDRDMLGSFWVDLIHITDEPNPSDESLEPYEGVPMRLFIVGVSVTKRPAEVLSFVLETLPPCDRLRLTCDANIQEAGNFVPMVCLYFPSFSARCRSPHPVRASLPYGI